VLQQVTAREMITSAGIGPYGAGVVVAQRGEGGYFGHDGVNWGFQCRLLAHVRKGYGLIVMTNADGGFPVIEEIESRVASAHGWDPLHPFLR